MSALEAIVKETKALFIIAVEDGALDSTEVIKIAVQVSQKLQALPALSGSDKKATLLYVLKKALDVSCALDSLPGLKGVSKEIKQSFENQLLNAASATIDIFVAASQGKLNLKNPSTYLTCLPFCLKAVEAVLDPKDAAVLQEALKFTKNVLPQQDTVTKVEDIVTE
jgi:hypothetical protein